MENERTMSIVILGIDLGKNSCSLAGLWIIALEPSTENLSSWRVLMRRRDG
jgi:hypothetical protein